MEGFERELVPLRRKRAELDAEPGRLTQALADGAEKARGIASETLREVRGVMGLGGHG
jgi:tryptophanyl-tRNA synthetase